MRCVARRAALVPPPCFRVVASVLGRSVTRRSQQPSPPPCAPPSARSPRRPRLSLPAFAPRPCPPVRHTLYAQERDATLESLERRATKLTAALDALEGISCDATHGSMYVFPSVNLPPAAVAAAAAGKQADTFYCLEMLDSTGIVVVPGSGFGQKEGTFHFRATILPPEEDMDNVIVRIADFHNEFVARYS